MRRLRIFTASPSDMAAARAKVATVAAMLKPLADSLDIVLDVIDWGAVVPQMGRPEQVILDQLKPTSWDVFIGILWHRFGTPSGATDPETQRECLSGTEEEFRIAHHLWKQHNKPRIMIYRCTRAVSLDALDPDQFTRVKRFFGDFDAVKGKTPGLYRSFDTIDEFEKLLASNLLDLLLQYGEQIKSKPLAPEVIQEFAPKLPDNLPRRAPFFGRDTEVGTLLRALARKTERGAPLLTG